MTLTKEQTVKRAAAAGVDLLKILRVTERAIHYTETLSAVLDTLDKESDCPAYLNANKALIELRKAHEFLR